MRRSENVRITFVLLLLLPTRALYPAHSFSKKTASGNYFQLRRRIASCREGGKSRLEEGSAVHPQSCACFFA